MRFARHHPPSTGRPPVSIGGEEVRPTPRAASLLRANRWLRHGRRLLLMMAALPLLQTTGCFPDLLGALNDELQMLVNSTLLNAANIIIRNLLGL